MSTLLELRSQVEKIQKQMFEIKARDRTKVMAEMVENMDAYEISIRDLQNALKKPAKVNTSVKGRKTAGGKAVAVKGTLHLKNKPAILKPKYLGPNGELWSGRGVMPKWIRGLIAAGRIRDEFLIKVGTESQPEAAAETATA